MTTTTVFTLGQEAQTQVDALTAQAQAVQAKLATLDNELDQKIDEYYQCLTDLNAAGARLVQLRREVGDAQAKKAQAQAVLAQRIKAVYMSGGRDQLLQLLLLADNLQDSLQPGAPGDDAGRPGQADSLRPQRQQREPQPPD